MLFSKVKLMTILFALAVVIITSVIFLKSFENVSASQISSDVIVDAIVSDDDDYIEKGNKEVLVRKAAHIVEYAVLGIAVIGLVLNIKKAYKRFFIGFAMFYVLAVAVADEHIQSFSDRTSSTNDIILDFIGALLGFGIVLGVCGLFKLIIKTKHNKQ